MSPGRRVALLLALAALTGCPVTPEVPPPPTGEGIFLEGCPVEGQATARPITRADAVMDGKWAVGTVGDFVLLNEAAAFVITRPDADSTYFYYGGIVADAAAVSGCALANQDKLEDIGLTLIEVDSLAGPNSRIRAIRGESIEVLNDGSDGAAAVVRVKGADAPHWLLEYRLQVDSIGETNRPFNVPFGVQTTVDYILDPGSAVLRIEVGLDGDQDSSDRLGAPALVIWGDTLDLQAYNVGSVSIAGSTLKTRVPWSVASDGAGAYAFAVQGQSMANMTVKGVQALLDLDKVLLQPLRPFLGSNNPDARYGYYLSVGATDANSATAPLAAVHASPLRDTTYTLVDVSGRVVDATTGEGVPGAKVTVRAQAPDGDEAGLDSVVADSTGAYTVRVPRFDPAWAIALQPSAPGRDGAESIPLDLDSNSIDLTLPSLGTLDYAIANPDGTAAAARIELVRDDGWSKTLQLFDQGQKPLRPGAYSWVATRGFEFAPVEGSLTVPPGGAATLSITTERVVDTTGWLSADTHIHSEGSSDSRTLRTRQLLAAASHGLEIPVSTEHDFVHGFVVDLFDAGLDGTMSVVSGLEMTATVPEHMTAFPIEPDGSPRGGIVKWYGMDLPTVVEATYERGAEVVLLNHPHWVGRIDWDPIAGEPGRDDPEAFGLAPDAQLWSWNFDGLEIMKNNGSPFRNGNGYAEHWMSFLNHGHKMTAVGASDAHGTANVGFPRTYFASSTDDPTAFSEAEMAAAYRDGRILISNGAFLRVGIGEAGIGDVVSEPDGTVDLWLHVEALPGTDVSEVVVFANCDEVLAVPTTDPAGVIKLDTTVPLTLTADSYLIVAALGVGNTPAGLPNPSSMGPRAITNAIYVDVDGNGAWDAPGGKTCSYDIR